MQSNSVTSYPLSAETTDSTTGLELKLELNSSALAYGMGITVHIMESNARNSTNLVNASNAWPLKGLALGPCGSSSHPMGVEIFKGYYTDSNISSARTALSIYPPGEYMCPMILRISLHMNSSR